MDLIGKYVIVRDDRAGVHGGVLAAFDGPHKCATLTGARKIWYWSGAAATHGIAARGINHANSKVCPEVERVELCDVVEVIACSPDGEQSVRTCPEWRT